MARLARPRRLRARARAGRATRERPHDLLAGNGDREQVVAERQASTRLGM